MAGKGARQRRQQKRANELGRGLVTKEDIIAVLGMSSEQLKDYAKEKNLVIRIFSVDGADCIIDKKAGTDILNIRMKDGFVETASRKNKPCKE